ncbi:MAG: riboflavin biosynthesis protein RibF [Liquorilactobacillus ghanensis]|uniref:riboflavin biosynthesis protein RibF n=1 Tax=Liquorilactobacillus ghanensis TaxID=399370 RepID=UPI0039EB7C51
MKTIFLKEPFDSRQIPAGEVVLALGFFDGVHRGHQLVIQRAAVEAKRRGCRLAIMTLDRQPAIVFQQVPAAKIQYLTTLQRKLELFAQLGIDIAYVAPLTGQLPQMRPQEFVDLYMAGLHAVAVVAGKDYTYGKHDIANMQLLPRYAQKRFDVIAVEHLRFQDQKISSTTIRHLLDTGEIAAANQLLGYTYQNSGLVVHGEQRGRKLGFPTLNLAIPNDERILAEGIYAVQVKVAGQVYQGMASIGRNETFGSNRQITVEINLFDFAQMVYDQQVTVYWYEKLRDQVKFTGAAALVEQLKADKQQTIAYFIAKKNKK